MGTLAISSANSKVWIAPGTPATETGAGYAALTWTQIKEVTDIGMIGPESAVILHNPVNENVTYKLRGSRNNGALDLKGARAATDPGQIILIAAEAATTPYNVKVELSNGTLIYSGVLVTSYKTSVGGQSQITGFESKMEISGAIVVV